jgi:hypothetical protein
MSKKPLQIDAVIATQGRDSQGEMLDIEGADITALEQGKGFWNDNHGKGFFNHIGRITDAKKIFKADDCEDDRQKYYWEKVKGPFIYAKGYLYDNEDHPNARATSAVLRSIHKTDAPLRVKASVEGGTVARGLKDPSILTRTKIMGSAITFTPANHATLVEPISLEKSALTEEDELLIKSVLHLAQENVPSFIDISKRISEEKISSNVSKIAELVKGLTAGYGGGAPTSATGGQVIQKESVESPKLKYITCDDCGKEQCYAKHQTKCRECNKSFSFAKLAKFFNK